MNPTTLTPDQNLVITTLDELLNAIRDNKNFERGDAVELMSAIGRARRLQAHQDHPSLDLVLGRAESLLQSAPWLREEAMLEGDWSQIAESAQAAILSEHASEYERLDHLLLLDEAICAIRACGDEDLAHSMAERVIVEAQAMTAHLAPLSGRAKNFIDRHKPRGLWGEVWNAIAVAKQNELDFATSVAEIFQGE